MRTTFYASLASIATASGLTAVPGAHAATISRELIVQGSSCQLSIPTTDTGARPKASGFRNESTRTSNFVICPFTVPGDTGNANAITALTVTLASLDNAARNVTCTAVAGSPGIIVPQYSSKTIATLATGNPIQIGWNGSDFGGTAGTAYPGSSFASVTCNLPPQVAITFLYAEYNYEIGT